MAQMFRQQYDSPQMRLAQALMQQGTQTGPVRHPMEGIGRVAQALSGAYMHRRLEDEAKQKEQKRNEALARALDVGTRSGGGFDEKTGITWQPHDARAAMARALMGNEETAPLAMNMQMDALASEDDFRRKRQLETYKAALKGQDAPKSRTVKRGGKEVTEEWDSAAGEWRTVGESPIPGKEPKIQQALDPETQQLVFATPTEIVQRGLRPVPSGLSLSTDKDGNVVLTTGTLAGQQSQELTTSTMNELQRSQLSAVDALARLEDIREAFRPEFLQLGTRLNMKGASLKEFVGIDLDPETREQLRDYAVFRRRATNNLNRLIKELSGVAVNPEEIKRLEAAMPTAGTGIFDGDSPTEFKAKMDDVMRALKMAGARYSYAQKMGLDPFTIPLEEVPSIIEQRGSAIEREIRMRMPNATPEVIQMEVRDRLKQEFNL